MEALHHRHHVEPGPEASRTRTSSKGGCGRGSHEPARGLTPGDDLLRVHCRRLDVLGVETGDDVQRPGLQLLQRLGAVGVEVELQPVEEGALGPEVGRVPLQHHPPLLERHRPVRAGAEEPPVGPALGDQRGGKGDQVEEEGLGLLEANLQGQRVEDLEAGDRAGLPGEEVPRPLDLLEDPLVGRVLLWIQQPLEVPLHVLGAQRRLVVEGEPGAKHEAVAPCRRSRFPALGQLGEHHPVLLPEQPGVDAGPDLHHLVVEGEERVESPGGPEHRRLVDAHSQGSSPPRLGQPEAEDLALEARRLAGELLHRPREPVPDAEHGLGVGADLGHVLGDGRVAPGEHRVRGADLGEGIGESVHRIAQRPPGPGLSLGLGRRPLCQAGHLLRLADQVPARVGLLHRGPGQLEDARRHPRRGLHHVRALRLQPPGLGHGGLHGGEGALGDAADLLEGRGGAISQGHPCRGTLPALLHVHHRGVHVAPGLADDGGDLPGAAGGALGQ